MAIHEKNRFVRIFHALVATLMLVAGGALVGTGIWLQVTDNAGPNQLVYSDNNFWKFVLNFGVAAIIVGAFLILAAVSGLIALSRECVGSCFKIIYVAMALLILLVLVVITVLSAIIREREDSTEAKEFFEDAWQQTVISSPQEICEIEDFYKCRGFNDSDCRECNFPDTTSCSQPQNCAPCGVSNNVDAGCYDEIRASIDGYFLPVAIVAGILSGIVIIDIFMACAL